MYPKLTEGRQLGGSLVDVRQNGFAAPHIDLSETRDRQVRMLVSLIDR